MKTCYKHTHKTFKSGLLYFEGVGCPICNAEKELKLMEDKQGDNMRQATSRIIRKFAKLSHNTYRQIKRWYTRLSHVEKAEYKRQMVEKVS